MMLDMENYPPMPRFCTNDPTDTKQYIDIVELMESIQIQPFGGIAFIQDSGFTLNKVLALSLITPDRLNKLERIIEEKTFLHRAYGTKNLFIAIPNQEEAIERNKRDFLYTLLLILSMTGKQIQIGIRDNYEYDNQ